jgi:alkylation response protein AidB-like acyl-CoA dehydrogenase
VEGGWPALSCDPEYGGQGLPLVVNQCFYEMLNSANQAWTMYPGLTHGAYAALHAHGTDEQKATYLPKLTSGEWTGTMCLTEPHCGTDLGLLRTKAEPQADGTYRITGQKIFISAGEHDMADNIVHLVLARLPDAPPGIKGISLFIVPKFLVNKTAAWASATASTAAAWSTRWASTATPPARSCLDGAIGTMVGQPNKGMQAMFVMMNAARLGVGNQSLGLTEVAYQNALAYAKDRIQMRSLSGPKAKDKPADPIIVHPDVRKMLLTAKAYAEGGRALAIFCAVLLDKVAHHPDEKVRKDSDEMLSLLTPIVKAFLTDNGWHRHQHCMQVFGGHGFIKEWGMEQFVRDARINMIYEGTNTIQSAGPAGPQGAGQQRRHAEEVRQAGRQAGGRRGRERGDGRVHQPAGRPGRQMTKFTTELGFKGFQNPTKWAPPRWTTCAWRATWCLATSLPAWPRWRCAKSPPATPTRSTRQAADGALLLCQAVPRDGDADAHRPRGQVSGPDDQARRCLRKMHRRAQGQAGAGHDHHPQHQGQRRRQGHLGRGRHPRPEQRQGLQGLRLKPVDGGKKLEMRGYIGPFYRTQVWLRVE